MPDLASARRGGDGPVRPGSMTAAMRAARPAPRESTGPRWLRWARVEDGRIVHEEVRSPDRPLTVGTAGSADVALPGAGFERRAVASFDGGWRLHVAPEWAGRLPQGPLSELGSLEADGWRVIPLDDEARGRIELGGVALLVQLVDRPVPKRAPPLPASVDGGLMQGADWWFTAFVTASFFVHFAVVAFLAERDWPLDATTTGIPPRIANVIFPEIEPPIDPPVETMTPDADDAVADADDAEPDADTDRADEPTPRRRITDARPTPGDAEADPTLVDRDVRRALHELIGAMGAEGSPIQDLIRDGRPTESQADVLARVAGADVAGDDLGRMDERDRGCDAACERRRRGIGAIAAHHGTGPLDEGATLVETVVRVTPPGIDTIEPEGPVVFDPRELHRVLRARMTAIRRCYEHELTRGNPDLSGRITLVMDVMPVGTLARVHGEDNSTGSDPLEACAVRAIRSARVRAGPDAPVTVRYPVVFARGG